MDTLEREVLEKFRQLDKDAQKRVRELIVQGTDSLEQADTAAFDYDAWWSEVDALREGIRARMGTSTSIGALSLLDELREEAS